MNGENTGCVSSFFLSSWRLADAIFAPRECFLGEEDEEIANFYKMRSTAGTIIILCVAVRFHRFNGLSETFGAVFQGISWTLEFTLLAMIPAVVAVACYTTRQKRREALVQMRYPMGAIGAWILITYGFLLFQRLLRQPYDSVALGLPLAIVGLAATVWFASFLIRAFYLMATGLFRLRDGHPLLPPAVTVMAAWALAIKGLLAGASGGGEPTALIVTLLIGGPISITILAALEIKRLKERYPDDFPFRNGPLLPKPIL